MTRQIGLKKNVLLNEAAITKAKRQHCEDYNSLLYVKSKRFITRDDYFYIVEKSASRREGPAIIATKVGRLPC